MHLLFYDLAVKCNLSKTLVVLVDYGLHIPPTFL